MDFSGTNFGYDEYNPINYYSVQPEDLNPAIRNKYIKQVDDYYAEPPVSRFQARTKRRCKCKNESGGDSNKLISDSTLYILIIVLVVITVLQWMYMLCSSSPIVINNINKPESNIQPVEESELIKSEV
jgi:hypothetical protein